MNSIEAADVLYRIDEMLKDPELIKFFKVTDQNFDSNTLFKWVDVKFYLNMLINEVDQVL